MWKFCNQIPLVFKVNLPGVLSLFAGYPVGKSAVGPRTFATVQELLWYNCSPVCGLFAQWLCGGAHILCLPGLLQPKPLSLQQATADLCLCRRHSDIQRQVWLSLLWGPWVLVHTRFCLSPLSVSGMYGVWFQMQFPRSYHLCSSPLPLDMGYLFLVGSNILLLMVVQQLLAVLEFSQEKMRALSSIPPYFWRCYLHIAFCYLCYLLSLSFAFK